MPPPCVWCRPSEQFADNRYSTPSNVNFAPRIRLANRPTVFPHARPVAEITFEIVVTEGHVREPAVPVGNLHRYDRRADIGQLHGCAARIGHLVKDDRFAFGGKTPDILFYFHRFERFCGTMPRVCRDKPRRRSTCGSVRRRPGGLPCRLRRTTGPRCAAPATEPFRRQPIY